MLPAVALETEVLLFTAEATVLVENALDVDLNAITRALHREGLFDAAVVAVPGKLYIGGQIDAPDFDRGYKKALGIIASAHQFSLPSGTWGSRVEFLGLTYDEPFIVSNEQEAYVHRQSRLLA